MRADYLLKILKKEQESKDTFKAEEEVSVAQAWNSMTDCQYYNTGYLCKIRTYRNIWHSFYILL